MRGLILVLMSNVCYLAVILIFLVVSAHYCSLLDGYCSLLVVTARYRSLLLVPTLSMNVFLIFSTSITVTGFTENFSCIAYLLLMFIVLGWFSNFLIIVVFHNFLVLNLTMLQVMVNGEVEERQGNLPFWICRSNLSEVFLRKGVLEIYRKFTGEHPYRSVISVLRHECSPVNLLHIFKKSAVLSGILDNSRHYHREYWLFSWHFHFNIEIWLHSSSGTFVLTLTSDSSFWNIIKFNLII